MAKAFFISDVHLGLGAFEKEKAKEERVVGFLQHVREHGSALFIVGDLFDSWLEYRTVVPKGYHRLLTALEDLTRSGIEVHYLAGNHDFWMRDLFHRHLRINTYSKPFSITIEGKKFFFHHGDGLIDNDWGYLILQAILRNPLCVWLYSWIHPDIGVRLAQFSSRGSRRHTEKMSNYSDSGLRDFAAKMIGQGYDFVVMGHCHKPKIERMGSGTYVNLGDWISYNSYAEFQDGHLELKTWNP
jgi:UDP-2,3-diacylglucosamine hydrolase